MPIGKNSIKRVANSGYSNVKSTAPDMENSEINEPKAEAASEKKPEAKKAAPKAAEKKAAPKAAEKKVAPKAAEKKVAPKAAKPEKNDTVSTPKFQLGDELPEYLL